MPNDRGRLASPPGRPDAGGGRPEKGSRLPSVVLGLVALPLIVLAIWPSLVPSTMPLLQTEAGSSNGKSGGGANGPANSRADWVAHILAVGDVSPAGVAARDVTAMEALRRAEAAIFAPDSAQPLAERRFWLRKSIAKLLAAPHAQWAASQLGTLHTAPAVPGGQPDYQAAKTLWEMAGASGDPVASCFVAQLYELGLGVEANPDRAKIWYERAGQDGGCALERRPAEPARTH